MKSLVYFSLLHSIWSAIPIVAALSLSNVKPTTSRVVPNRFLIEVDTIAAISNKRAFARTLDAVYDSIRARDVAFEVNLEYEVEGLFVGASVTIASADDAVKVAAIPGIKSIHPVAIVPRPKPIEQHALSGPEGPVAIGSTISTHVATSQVRNWQTHGRSSQGVNKVHAQGIFGKGIKIGIIDTGIDYTHPLLGGGFGPGNKVVGGYDFVGDDFTGEDAPKPDNDPMDNCVGHGTHVAGIIAADPNNSYNITGVAHKASISAYRVFGCQGFSTDDVIIAALMRAAEEGQDVVNLPLGDSGGWSSTFIDVVASRIAGTGVAVVMSAGNSGVVGSWYAGSPASGTDVIAVGSVENLVLITREVIVTGVEHAPIPYISFTALPIDGAYPIYALSNDTTIPNDACEPLPDNTPDLSGFVVIVRRGGCTIVSQQVANIQAKGAQRALVYDNVKTPSRISGAIPIALILAADGQFLVDQFIAGSPIELSFPQGETVSYVPNPNGGLMSSFSSYGPSFDFHFKPAISAPGGNILSLLPVSLGSYSVQSGTSMSAPFAAGCAALLLQSKGKSAALNVRTLFETTAQSIPSAQAEESQPQTLTQQGAGLINVYDALFSTTSVSKGELILNDTANYKQRHTFVVKNDDKKSKNYSLSHVPAGTALTIQENSIYASTGPVPLIPNTAQALEVHPATLRAGQSQTVTVNFSPPKGLDSSQYPVYSGFIHVEGPGENLHVSYLGLAASLKNRQVVDNTDTIFETHKLPLLLDSKQEAQTGPTNYTFVENDFPTFVYSMAFGSPLIRLDLVEPNTSVKSSLSTRGLENRQHGGGHGHLFTFPGIAKLQSGGSFSKVKAIGPLYEQAFLARNDLTTQGSEYNTVAFVSPEFANGTRIANGPYRVLFRALKVPGDRNKQEDYETWVSPIVGINA